MIFQFGIVLHEIGHVLGLVHTQQRSDRDNSIIIHEHQVQYPHHSQFWIQNTEAYGTDYDYSSVMHYADKVKE